MIWRCINVSEVVLVIVSRYVAIGIFCILIDTFIYLAIAVLTSLVGRVQTYGQGNHETNH